MGFRFVNLGVHWWAKTMGLLWKLEHFSRRQTYTYKTAISNYVQTNMCFITWNDFLKKCTNPDKSSSIKSNWQVP